VQVNTIKKMNILIFGASGDTGHELVSQALIQDHFVTAFVRDPTKFQLKHVSLRIFKGDVTDYRNVEDAVTRCRAFSIGRIKSV